MVINMKLTARNFEHMCGDQYLVGSGLRAIAITWTGWAPSQIGSKPPHMVDNGPTLFNAKIQSAVCACKTCWLNTTAVIIVQVGR